MKSILGYNDYRDYLYELFKDLKQRAPHTSYQYCADRINSSKSYLKLLFDKKRHTSLNKISDLCRFFGVEGIEKKYLVFLFLKNISSEDDIVSIFNEVLSEIELKENFIR